jgi:hypothetical protein
MNEIAVLDSYLKAVGRNLPASQRDDILKDLAENVRSQIEDKEGHLDRPLTDAELIDILKHHGHPLIVAGRYQGDERTLALGRRIIGPALFPFYIKVLSFNLGVTTTLLAAIFLILSVVGLAITAHAVISALFWQLVIQLTIVTVIFAATEKYFASYPDKWDPWTPYADFSRFLAAGASVSAAESGGRVSRFQSLARFVAAAVFLVWLRAITHSAQWIFGGAVGAFQVAPLWHKVYLPFELLILLLMVAAGINLARPQWVRFSSVVRVLAGAGGVMILAVALKTGHIVAVSAYAVTPANLRAAHIVNTWFMLTMAVSAVWCFAALLFNLIRFLRDFRKPAAPPTLPFQPLSGPRVSR